MLLYILVYFTVLLFVCVDCELPRLSCDFESECAWGWDPPEGTSPGFARITYGEVLEKAKKSPGFKFTLPPLTSKDGDILKREFNDLYIVRTFVRTLHPSLVVSYYRNAVKPHNFMCLDGGNQIRRAFATRNANYVTARAGDA